MLTDEDLKKLRRQIKGILNTGYKDLQKDLKGLSDGNKVTHAKLDSIEKKLDEFLSIMKHFAREQKILIKKMREIEKYFDPPGRN